jgi:DNA-binding NtrC family response regulator
MDIIKPNVLIVEDNEVFRGSLVKYFNRKNKDYPHNLLLADNLTEANALLDKNDIQIIIVDVIGIDGDEQGIDFVKRLIKQKPHLRIALMTGYDNREEEIKVLEIPYLIKGPTQPITELETWLQIVFNWIIKHEK